MTAADSELYEEITVHLPSQTVDAAGNFIIENIAGGIVLEDEDGSEEVAVKFFLPDSDQIDSTLESIIRYLSEIGVSRSPQDFRRKKLKSLDWIDAYKKSLSPLMVGEGICIKPSWITEAFPDKIEVLLEPKMSFGTGRHETTRSCLIEMEQMDFEKKKILDLGCGSGILSIYAAKRGAAEVAGFDIDIMAVKNSEENFRLNGVEHHCTARLGTLHELESDKRFDIIVVNIIKAEIVPILADLKKHLHLPGTLILSGFLDADQEEMRGALEASAMSDHYIRRDGEWLTYVISCR